MMEEERISDSGYNFIYNKLVSDKNDVLGVIAYSVYKRQKIEYLANIHKKHGRPPDVEELAFFHDFSNSSMQIKSYNDQAVELARSFSNAVLQEDVQKLSDFYAEKSRQEISRLKPRFWLGVAQSVVGSVAFVFAVGALVIFTWSLNQGPKQVVENVFNVTITSQVASES